MLSNISIDMILSDPMLLTGVGLFLFGSIGFLIAFFKYITTKSEPKQEFVVPTQPDISEPEPEQYPSQPAEPEQIIPEPEPDPVPEPEPIVETRQEEPAPAPVPEPAPPPPEPAPTPVQEASDKTVVIPPVVNELQGQVEIAFSQIRDLNSKANDLEQQVELLQNQKGAQLEPNQLKEGPSNPSDFSQKLLKLAEHVIILEKEVARLKAEQKSKAAQTEEKSTEASDVQKPPIMPL